MYSIQDLETLSGVKAHTIRIWEKRYQLLNPHRSKTNIRAYDDRQLVKLLHVSTLLQHGGKISKVSALDEEEINAQIDALMQPKNQDAQSDLFINQLIAAGMSYDAQTFESTFAAAMNKFSIFQCYMQVILPMMIRLGLMWGKNELLPVQEHFISNIIRQKLFSAIDGLAHSTPSTGKKFILFLPAREDHDIGLLFAYYMIKQAGHAVVYLGNDVPTKNLEEAIKSSKADTALFFLVRNWPEQDLKALKHELDLALPHGQIIISGKTSIIESIRLGRNWSAVHSIEDLQALI